MTELKEKLAVLLGSRADYRVVQQGLRLLQQLEIPCRVLLAPAPRLEGVAQWVHEAERCGIEVFIVAQGGSATLPGVVASLTARPVIGVPLDTTRERGRDAVLSMAQLPAGGEILMTGVNGIESAIHAALRVLSLGDPAYQRLLAELRERLSADAEAELRELEEDFQQLRGPAARVSLSGRAAPRGEVETQHDATPEKRRETPPPEAASTAELTPIPPEPKAAPPTERAPDSPIIPLNSAHPNFDFVEQAVHALLAGKVIALPTDTVYGLAADATNLLAVKRLMEMKGRKLGHPLPVMVCNEAQLKQLVTKTPEPVLQRLDDFWPGSLTLVFEKYPNSFPQISTDDTIGVRIPDHNVTLGILSMINRPLAVTSANPSGQPPALTAAQVREYFAGELEIILDAGEASGPGVSTVLDVRKEPYQILREGLTSRERLNEIFPDKIAESEV